jgi:Acetyltransferase (GNAT) domain
MPPFTHVLGPAVDAGVGKPQTRLLRRLSITRSLIDQLPSIAYFTQHFDPSLDDGLALSDGLAFQDRGFQIAPQYTFQIDCSGTLDALWSGMHFKTRQHIRRAEERFTIGTVDDATQFINFYLKNIKASGKTNQTNFDHFPVLFSECRARSSGEILAALAPDGIAVAMAYLVWGHGTMYYLLSTRIPNSAGDNGSVNLLLWNAIKRAHQYDLVLDLDGVYSSGTARFLSTFGGQIKTRFVLRRSQRAYRALQYLKSCYSNDKTHYFA